MQKQRRAWEAREMAGLSVAQVAHALGKSLSTVHAWELDTVPRRPEDIVALCQLYGITTDWYLEGRGPMYRNDTQACIDSHSQRIMQQLGRLQPAQRAALAQLVQTMLPD